MSDRKATIKMDGREGEIMEVETGVPQGSPVSPILFDIYISELFLEADRQQQQNLSRTARLWQNKEEENPKTTALSFVDDVAWVVKGKDISKCVRKMRVCKKGQGVGGGERRPVRHGKNRSSVVFKKAKSSGE
jgi:hypothetical protein